MIVLDFVATALPDTAKKTVVRSSNKIMTRKNVVAPFINDATTSVANTATVLDINADSSMGSEPVQCRPGIEYLKLVTLGCGVTMDDFVKALKEDAHVRHQIVHDDDDLVRLLSSGDQSAEGIAAAILRDLQERLSAGEYGERNLLEIAVHQKKKQQAATVPGGQSFPVIANAGPPRGSRAEVVHRRTFPPVSKLETIFNSWSAIETMDVMMSRRLNPSLVQQSRRETNAVVPQGVPQTPHISGPAVSHGDQTMQESSSVANGGLITTRAGESEGDGKLHSEEQRMILSSNDEEGKCPIEIAHSVAFDEKSTPFPARKGSAMLPSMEDSKMQNALSQSRPNMVGMVASSKVNAVKGTPSVQKMPAFDLNFESLSTEELKKFKKQVR